MTVAESTTTGMYQDTLKVDAMSRHHAERVAAGILDVSMDRIVEVQEIKPSREAKTCSTDDFPVKGAKKWETSYEIYAYGEKVPTGRDTFIYLNKELVRDNIGSKTEAVQIARDMSIKHQLPMTVQVVQKLVTHTTTSADIIPKTKKGQYLVIYYKRTDEE